MKNNGITLYGKVLVFSIFISLPSTSIFGQAEDPFVDVEVGAQPLERFQAFTFTTDQDVLSAYNEDRNYTMGLQLFYSAPRFFEETNASYFFITPFLRRGLDKICGISNLWESHRAGNYVSTFGIESGAFTPLDLELKRPDTLDRPYGSILSLVSSRITTFNDSGSKHPFSLYSSFHLGVLGTHVGKAVQSHIHENMWLGSTRPVPQGWNNQISDGGELTALYTVGYLAPVFGLSHPQIDNHHLVQLITDLSASVGYYTNIAAQLQFRIGLFNTPYWVSTGNTSSISQSTQGNSKRWIQAFVFGQLNTRYVLYNALLQGQFRKNSFDLSRSEISPIVFNYEMGIFISIRDRLNIIYKPLMFRSNEMLTRERSHIWSGISLTYIISKSTVF